MTGVVAAVLLIPAVIATVRLLTGHRYPGLTPFVGFFLFMLIVLVATFLLAFVQLLRTEHDLRAAMRGDDRVAPPVLTQPDQQQALHYGETLALTRRMRTGGYWGYLGLVTLSAVFVVPLMTFCGEAIVYLALPHASGWILAWIFNRHSSLVIVPPPRMTPAEWIVVLVPAMAVSAFCFLAIWSQISLRRQIIMADDRGVTVKCFLRRREFIPWDDVRLLVESRFETPVRESYWLRGSDHGIVVDFGDPRPTTEEGEPRRPVHLYDGGVDAYEASVQRLLSTIIARAHVPLRTWATGYYGHSRSAEDAPLGLTAKEVAAMPQAGTQWQPSAQAISQAAASGAPILLCANIPLRQALRPAIVVGSAFGGALFLFIIVMVIAQGGNLQRAYPGLSGPGGFSRLVLAIGLLFLLGFTFRFIHAAQIYRVRVPAIMAEDNGLTVKGYGRKKLVAVDWKDIHAWAIVQPDPGMPDGITYAIYTDEATLTWTEPAGAKLVWQRVEGDRREAYRAAAEKLHATIAARTGLPLHLISR